MHIFSTMFFYLCGMETQINKTVNLTVQEIQDIINQGESPHLTIKKELKVLGDKSCSVTEKRMCYDGTTDTIASKPKTIAINDYNTVIDSIVAELKKGLEKELLDIYARWDSYDKTVSIEVKTLVLVDPSEHKASE